MRPELPIVHQSFELWAVICDPDNGNPFVAPVIAWVLKADAPPDVVTPAATFPPAWLLTTWPSYGAARQDLSRVRGDAPSMRWIN